MLSCLAVYLSSFESKIKMFFAFFVLIPPHVSLIQNAKLQMHVAGWFGLADIFVSCNFGSPLGERTAH